MEIWILSSKLRKCAINELCTPFQKFSTYERFRHVSSLRANDHRIFAVRGDPAVNIVVADSVALGREAFEDLGEVRVVPETEIDPGSVRDADAVVTRSKTRLIPALFSGSKVQFAGTCTAGIDHADPEGLQQLGIHFAFAPGCNANAVSEMVLAALLESGQEISGKTVGIVGHGQVGTRVDRKLSALGCRILRSDPPKEKRGEPGPFVPLNDLLSESDVVTLHVPLVEEGPTPTRHLVSAEGIARMKPGAMLINACRGEALDAEAACAARAAGALSWLVLDVWDPEPDLPPLQLAAADLGSPHVAGHSVEGKVNGTRQIREALIAHFGLTAEVWDPEPLMPPPEQPVVVLSLEGTLEERLRSCVRAAYDIHVDDRDLREAERPMKEKFTRLRRNYRDRREFPAIRVLGLRAEEQEIYRELGFQVS
jgi:erythronate-4-phosphate dehydrogenase